MPFNFSYMDIAIREAELALSEGEVPIGAVVVQNKEIIAAAHNQVISLHDPTAHAEVLAIRKAGKALQSHILENCEIYVTLEPCAMCTKAIMQARIEKIYFGAYNFKTGSIFHGENMIHLHKNILKVIGGIREYECSQSLKSFFQARR